MVAQVHVIMLILLLTLAMAVYFILTLHLKEILRNGENIILLSPINIEKVDKYPLPIQVNKKIMVLVIDHVIVLN